MFATAWLTLPSSRLITLTLLHFVWQGFAVALLLHFLLEACRLRRAGARYACSLVALMVMVVAPLITLGVLMVSRSSEVSSDFGPFEVAVVPSPEPASFSAIWLTIAEPYLLAAWLIGVAIFGGRLLSGAVSVARLRRSCFPVPAKLRGIIDQLGKQLKINAESLVFLSEQVTDAMAVGLMRPLVLLPAAWVTEMPLEMLEAVIAHELAHLVRRDLWVNLLQRLVETVLFYHPAVWWLSRRLRIERELCADELAVAATGKRLEYAQALEQIAGERLADIRPALAAFLRGENEMRLLQRVRNVLKQSPEERSRLWPAGLAALALPLGLWAAAAWNNAAVADDEEKKPVIKREREERTEAKRATPRVERERSEKDKRVEEGTERSARFLEVPILERKKSVPAEVREERYTIIRDGKPVEERVERVVVARDGKPLTVDVEGNRSIREDGKRDGTKPERTEVKEERRTIQVPEDVFDYKIVTRDGKPITVAVPKNAQPSVPDDRRLNELTIMVKQLTQNVERLQDEVSHLRAQKQGEPLNRARRETEERSRLELPKRELQQDMEKVETAKRDLEAKAKAIQQQAQEKAEAAMRAAGEKAEAQERAAKQQAEAAAKAAVGQKQDAERARTKEQEGRGRVEEEIGLKEKRSAEVPGLKTREVPKKIIDMRDKTPGEREEALAELRKEREALVRTKEEGRASAGREAPKKIIDARGLREKQNADREKAREEIKKLEERLQKLKEGQVEPSDQPEVDFEVLNEVTVKRMIRDQQALLHGPAPQPTARPEATR